MGGAQNAASSQGPDQVRILASLLVALFLPLAAAAADKPARIEDFAGPWIGQTVGDSDVERRATLLIEPVEPDGFSVEWSSFEASEDGEPTARQRRLVFRPAERKGLWRAGGANDPVADHAAWAFIANRTLTVNVAAVRDDGRLERQVYYRTLTRDGLTLAYRRFVDDELERALELKYVRLLDQPR